MTSARPFCHGRRGGALVAPTPQAPPAVTWLAGGFCLHNVEATLLGTLQARVAEQGQRVPLIRDAVAPKILQQLGCARRSEPTLGAYRRAALRSATLDGWVREFLADNPNGVVVELGVGLDTRFERIDNGHGSWIEIDLPRVIQLRKHSVAASARRQLIASSVTSLHWLDAVAASPGPFCFVAEALLGYVAGPIVRWIFDAIALRFPGAIIVFDTHPKWAIVAGQLVHQPLALADRQGEVVDAIAGWSNKLALQDFVPLLPRSSCDSSGRAVGADVATSALTRWTVTRSHAKSAGRHTR